MSKTVTQWSVQCQDWLQHHMQQDSAHDMSHLQRVVLQSQRLAKIEQADVLVVTLAAWLHDLVNYPKTHPWRAQASTASAHEARVLLTRWSLDAPRIDAVVHAIEAHSFSADITPQSLEACVLQDADRLDALGALGIARCFTVGGGLDRALYNIDDPFCDQRLPEDQCFTLDHFYQKLLHLAGSFKTQAGQLEAQRRSQYMHGFLAQLRDEISHDSVLDNGLDFEP